MTNRSKITFFFAVLVTGIAVISGAAHCQAAGDRGSASIGTVEVVETGDVAADRAATRNQAVENTGDIGSARSAATATDQGGDIGAAPDAQTDNDGDIGIGK